MQWGNNTNILFMKNLYLNIFRFHKQDQVRNESLIVSYASSLCTIARLSEAHGLENFDDTDKGYFLLNRFRKWNGTCKAINMYRRRCRVPQPKPQRLTKYGIRQGPPSTLFSKLDVLFSCDENVMHKNLWQMYLKNIWQIWLCKNYFCTFRKKEKIDFPN